MSFWFWIYLVSFLVYLAAFADGIRRTGQVTAKDVLCLVLVGAMPVVNTVMAAILAVYAAKLLLRRGFWDRPLWSRKP
jgi:hypothetical protein